MAGNNGQPFGLPSCGLSLPTPRSRYESDMEDSPELPESVIPFRSDSYLTPGPLPQRQQHHRQHQITQNSHQQTFDSWNLGLGMPQQSQPSHAQRHSQQVLVERLDHNTLLLNPIYEDLYHQNIRLKSQLDYAQEMVRSMMHAPRKTQPLASGFGLKHMSSIPAFDPGSRTVGAPFSSSGTSSHELLTQLDRKNYPGVQYWRKSEWNGRNTITSTTVVNNSTGIKGKKRRAAGINVNCGFVEDENGIPVDGFRITGISNRLREIWRECYAKGIAPPTWGKGTATFRDFVRLQIYHHSPELRLCEDHWKLDMIATTNYPGWYGKNVLGDNDDDSENDGSGAGKENRKNDDYMHLPQKRGSTAVPQAVKKKKKLKIPVLAKTEPASNADPVEQMAANTMLPAPGSSSEDTPSSSSIDLPTPTAVESSSETSLLALPTELPTASTAASSPTLPPNDSPGPMSAEHPTASNEQTLVTEQALVITQAVQDPLIAVQLSLPEPDKDKPIESPIETPQTLTTPSTGDPLTLRLVDPFASSQAVIPTAIPQQSTSSTSNSKGKKKFYTATQSSTPKNLFAKDFCAKNQVSKTEFDAAWEQLDLDQKQVYITKSAKVKQDIKEAKAAAAKAAKAAAGA